MSNDKVASSIHRGDPLTVDRYTAGARVNHWITAACLVLLALSGLSLFHPSLFFLAALFGGGAWTRVIHPWIGVVLFFSFAGLFLRFWHQNLWKGADTTWMVRLNKVLGNRDDEDPELVEIGKYNAGQKVVFWAMSILIILLIGSGLAIWNRYFSDYVTIEQRRLAMIVHSIFAIVIICVWIVHLYAAIWVRGTISAMTRGRVTGGWAWKHHRKWLKELVAGKPSG